MENIYPVFKAFMLSCLAAGMFDMAWMLSTNIPDKELIVNFLCYFCGIFPLLSLWIVENEK